MKLSALEISFDEIVHSLILEGFVRDDAVEFAMLLENQDRAQFLLTQFGLKLLQRFTVEKVNDAVPPMVMTELGTIEPVGFLPDAEVQDGPDAKKEPDPRPGKLVAYILARDPTQNKAYARWIAIRYIKGEKIEDINQMLTQQLSLFQRAAQSRRIPNANLDNYKSFAELYTAVEPFVVGDREVSGRQDRKTGRTTGVDVKKERQWDENDPMRSQALVLLDDDDYMILVPKTREAAAYFGKNTNWCTTSGHYEYYSEKGNLIIILRRKDGRRWQFHFESHQFMDEKDRPINVDTWMDENPEAVKAIGLNKFAMLITTKSRYGGGVSLRHFPMSMLEDLPTDVLAGAVSKVADLKALPETRVYTPEFFRSLNSSLRLYEDNDEDNIKIVHQFAKRLPGVFWDKICIEHPGLLRMLPEKMVTPRMKEAIAKGMHWANIDKYIPQPWSESIDESYWVNRCKNDIGLEPEAVPKKYRTIENLDMLIAYHPYVLQDPEFKEYLSPESLQAIVTFCGSPARYKGFIERLPQNLRSAELFKYGYTRVQELKNASQQDSRELWLEGLALFPHSLWPTARAPKTTKLLALVNPNFLDNPEQFHTKEFAADWAEKNPMWLGKLPAEFVDQNVVRSALTQYPKGYKGHDGKWISQKSEKVSFFKNLLGECDPKIVKPEWVSETIPLLGDLNDVWGHVPDAYVTPEMKEKLLAGGFISFGWPQFKGKYTGVNIAARFMNQVKPTYKTDKAIYSYSHSRRGGVNYEKAPNVKGMQEQWEFLNEAGQADDAAKKEAVKLLLAAGYNGMVEVVPQEMLGTPDMLDAWFEGLKKVQDQQKYQGAEKFFSPQFHTFPESAYTPQNLAQAVKWDIIKEIPKKYRDDDTHYEQLKKARWTSKEHKIDWSEITRDVLLKAIARAPAEIADTMHTTMPKTHPLLSDPVIALALLKKIEGTDNEYSWRKTAEDNDLKYLYREHPKRRAEWGQEHYELCAGNIIPLKSIPKKFWNDATLVRAVTTDPTSIALLKNPAEWMNEHPRVAAPYLKDHDGSDATDLGPKLKTRFVHQLSAYAIVMTPDGWVDFRKAKKEKIDGAPGQYVITEVAPKGEALLIFSDAGEHVSTLLSGVPNNTQASYHSEPEMIAAALNDEAYSSNKRDHIGELGPYRKLLIGVFKKHPEFVKNLPAAYHSTSGARSFERMHIFHDYQTKELTPIEEKDRKQVRGETGEGKNLWYVSQSMGSYSGNRYYMFDGEHGPLLGTIKFNDRRGTAPLETAKIKKSKLSLAFERAGDFASFLYEQGTSSGKTPAFMESDLYTKLGIRGPGSGQWYTVLQNKVKEKGPLKVWRANWNRSEFLTITHDQVGVLVVSKVGKDGTKREYESSEISNYSSELEDMIADLKSNKS